MTSSLLKRLFCRHRRWHKDPPSGMFQLGRTRFVCLRCGKHKYFDPLDRPIDYPFEPQM